MKPSKTLFLILGVFVVLAVLYLSSDNGGTGRKADDSQLFAAVAPDSIARISISEGAEKVELIVADDRWIVPARDGYLAAADKIRSLLLRMLTMRVSQKVSDDVNQHARFGVAEESVKTGNTYLSFQDDRGKELVGFYLGETRRSRNLDPEATGGGGQYIRRANDNAVYLIPDSLSYSALPAQWLKTELIGISEDRVLRVRQLQLNPEPVQDFTLLVADPGSPRNYRLERQASDEESTPVESAVASQVATGLENFRIEDVEAASDGKEQDLRQFDRATIFELDNGQRLTVETAVTTVASSDASEEATAGSIDTYARVRVEFDPLLVEEVAKLYSGINERRANAATSASESPQGENTESEEPVSKPLPPLPLPKVSSAEETQKFNQQFSKWRYKLPKYQADKYRKSRPELLKKSTSAS